MEEQGMTLVIKALRYAAKAHRDQRRKGARQAPYINHPIDLMHLLWNEGGVRDENILCAALLHDTIEDTTVSYEDLRREFGSDIANLVHEVTDDKSLAKEERKRLQVQHAAHKSLQARQIKLADKISNVRDVVSDPPKGWPKERIINYIHWARDVATGLRGSNQALEAVLAAVIEQALNHYNNPEGSAP